MKLSFIIPAYNEEKRIEKCVRSILTQRNLPEYEVIVVDNNSDDRTVEIVQKNFPEVRIVKESKQGMTIARNRGAKEAVGDMLVFFDADVIVPPHWIERVIKMFSKNKDLVGISGPFKFNDLPFKYKFVEFIDFQIFYRLVELVFNRILKKGSLWVGGNVAVKTEAFWAIGGFNENIVFYGEDIDLPTKLMEHGKVRFIFELWVWSSARRLIEGNPIKEGFRYVLNYIWYLLFNKSRGKSYKEVR